MTSGACEECGESGVIQLIWRGADERWLCEDCAGDRWCPEWTGDPQEPT